MSRVARVENCGRQSVASADNNGGRIRVPYSLIERVFAQITAVYPPQRDHPSSSFGGGVQQRVELPTWSGLVAGI